MAAADRACGGNPGGRLRGDLLRIDAPHRATLLELQGDLAANPLSLAELLSAQESEFLVMHAKGSSRRHYLYSWGLAYYLAFHQNLLGSPAFERYVRPDENAPAPIQAFENFVGRPLADFERDWRNEMRAIKALGK